MAENVVIAETEDGVRLDRWLKKHYPDLPFGALQKIIRTGQLRVDGKRAKGDTRLAKGQMVRIPPQLTAPAAGEKRKVSPKEADFIRARVLYEDEALIAINKPAGLASQGGSKINRHIDGLLDGLAVGGVRPHLVHRLDKDTSGVMILARNPQMAKKLGDIFSGREAAGASGRVLRKYYWAITVPAPLRHQGKIKSVIAKTAGAGGEKMRPVDEGKGKTALTYYQVMETAGTKLAWVAFWPRTGRTHQIRVHALEMGCPLLGDYKYGPHQELLEETAALPNMLHLHARRIILPHPLTGKPLDITAPLDKAMRKTWDFFNFNPDDKSDPFEDME